MITIALQQKEKITGVMTMSRLVVVSNRIAPPDEHAASAGGLAVGILWALKAPQADCGLAGAVKQGMRISR